MGLGNRGMAFEMLINLANEMYRRGQVALINKRPTPVKVLKSKGGRVLNGFYEAKSTVDYDGVYKGRAIAFEAKSTEKDTRFDLKNIAQHQLDYLEKAERMGAICFFLIEFSKDKSVFAVPLLRKNKLQEQMLRIFQNIIKRYKPIFIFLILYIEK
ncbi:Holliday junction resolvase RecU [Bacillus toyonensis]|uniref:Holliday junction resolvase RecU n=1 Tax=Bacillus toyonensis TaxID=155322 RepID=UPI00211D91A7|nr:Holliday junction resolvase RecU [Bacillus toyonensis]